MRTTNIERLFIIATSFALNKLLLFWLIGSRGIFTSSITLILLVLNFMILANSLDKCIDTYEKAKKKSKILY